MVPLSRPEKSSEVRLFPCSPDKMGDKPVLDIELGRHVGERSLLHDHLVDDIELVLCGQLAAAEFLCLAICIKFADLIGRIGLSKQLLVPILRAVELLLEELLPRVISRFSIEPLDFHLDC